MKYVIAVFRSRYSTLNFANILRANGIPVAIINTPQEISHACGISVKFLSDYYSKVQSILSKLNKRSFDGLYSYVEKNGKISIIKCG